MYHDASSGNLDARSDPYGLKLRTAPVPEPAAVPLPKALYMACCSPFTYASERVTMYPDAGKMTCDELTSALPC